jgi:hypothetical protein
MPSIVPISLIDSAVAAPAIEAAGGQFAGMTSWRRRTRRVAVFDGRQAADLGGILRQPETGFLDLSCVDVPPMPVLSAALILRLATATALRLDVASAFAAAVAERFPELRPLETKMGMALQEAVGNAVLHGNLELKTAQRGNLRGLSEFAAEMERRLADDAYASRPVTIGAVRGRSQSILWVEDRGRGFLPPEPRGIRLSAAGGNGLAMIRSCTQGTFFSHGGRRIRMIFGEG